MGRANPRRKQDIYAVGNFSLIISGLEKAHSLQDVAKRTCMAGIVCFLKFSASCQLVLSTSELAVRLNSGLHYKLSLCGA